jgi:Holliday junction resolvase RusA-like endonuclease
VTRLPYTFELPLPPPDNERLMFNKSHGRFILTSKYRNYKTQAQQRLMVLRAHKQFSLLKPTFENQIHIIITPFMPNKRRDPHGILKALLDVLQGYVIDNDRWLMPVFNPALIDEKNPRVKVTI